jgi:hypothetical protein
VAPVPVQQQPHSVALWVYVRTLAQVSLPTIYRYTHLILSAVSRNRHRRCHPSKPSRPASTPYCHQRRTKRPTSRVFHHPIDLSTGYRHTKRGSRRIQHCFRNHVQSDDRVVRLWRDHCFPVTRDSTVTRIGQRSYVPQHGRVGFRGFRGIDDSEKFEGQR